MAVRVPKCLFIRAHARPRCFIARARPRPFFDIMDIIDQVKAAQRAGSKFGTGRAAELLDRLGRPDEKLKIVHVAGSNGKGSVCAYVTAALVCAGRRTGTFTSPEVYSYEEQFCIDGRPAARAVIRRYLAAAEDAARGMSDAPSAFELETCAALAMFAGEGCEYCVLECGLGGLCDATNAVSRKEVALITSISREHTAVLGDDIADICRHKAGIIKNCPALVPANLCAEAARYFSSLGAEVAGGDVEVLRRSRRGQSFRCGGRRYFIRMPGDEQIYNAALAVCCAGVLGLPRRAVARGLARATLPGRVERVKSGRTLYILDGSHNPQSFGPLVQTLSTLRGSKTLVFTCLSDKDASAAARILGPLFARAFIVPAPSYRAMDVKKISAAFMQTCADVRVFADIPAAMESARDKTVAACGSFTLLKEVKQWIEQRR